MIRIFGHDIPAGTHDNNTWLLNGSKEWEGIGKLAGWSWNAVYHNFKAEAGSVEFGR